MVDFPLLMLVNPGVYHFWTRRSFAIYGNSLEMENVSVRLGTSGTLPTKKRYLYVFSASWCLGNLVIYLVAHGVIIATLPETNIAPKNGWLEDYF